MRRRINPPVRVVEEESPPPAIERCERCKGLKIVPVITEGYGPHGRRLEGGSISCPACGGSGSAEGGKP